MKLNKKETQQNNGKAFYNIPYKDREERNKHRNGQKKKTHALKNSRMRNEGWRNKKDKIRKQRGEKANRLCGVFWAERGQYPKCTVNWKSAVVVWNNEKSHLWLIISLRNCSELGHINFCVVKISIFFFERNQMNSSK